MDIVPLHKYDTLITNNYKEIEIQGRHELITNYLSSYNFSAVIQQ